LLNFQSIGNQTWKFLTFRIFRKKRHFLQKMRKLVKKYIFLKVIGIVSKGSNLFKTVGLLAVRLDLTKLRLKNWKEKPYF